MSRLHRYSGRQRGVKSRANAVATGIGDDCAVLRIPPGHEILVTTDFSLEGVHFRREWHPAESVGHRCLARGLSDIAAMGGDPIAAFLSLALPQEIRQNWVDRFLKGFLNLAAEFNVSLAGGDTSQSPDGVLADIVVVGSVPKGKAILRSGARPGDRIYVTGDLGGSAATLEFLYSGKKKRLDPRRFPNHFFPTARINIARVLRAKQIATSMIDISDGLSTDLSHICDQSGVGAELWASALPLATVADRKVDLKLALHGGEAYELLFTAKGGTRVPAQIVGVPVTCIGEIMRRKNLTLVRANFTRTTLRVHGWQHFQQPTPDK
ncbi:MAG TPA: thiamine-phosphate kinase [Terriglobales bacterium]|nr:thiamine-phosphate kinase [Terriglobales bacterium]